MRSNTMRVIIFFLFILYSSTYAQPKSEESLIKEEKAEKDAEALANEHQKQMIHKVLGHDHEKDGETEEYRTSVIDSMLKSGAYPKEPKPEKSEPLGHDKEEKTKPPKLDPREKEIEAMGTKELMDEYLALKASKKKDNDDSSSDDDDNDTSPKKKDDNEKDGTSDDPQPKGKRAENLTQPKTLTNNTSSSSSSSVEIEGQEENIIDTATTQNGDADTAEEEDKSKIGKTDNEQVDETGEVIVYIPPMDEETNTPSEAPVMVPVDVITERVLPLVVFAYDLPAGDALTDGDYSNVSGLSQSIFIDLFSQFFARHEDVLFQNSEIKSYVIHAPHIVQYNLTAYFLDNGNVPAETQLVEVAANELIEGAVYYDVYMRILQTFGSGTFKDIKAFTFITEQEDLEAAIAAANALESTEEQNEVVDNVEDSVKVDNVETVQETTTTEDTEPENTLNIIESDPEPNSEPHQGPITDTESNQESDTKSDNKEIDGMESKSKSKNSAKLIAPLVTAIILILLFLGAFIVDRVKRRRVTHGYSRDENIMKHKEEDVESGNAATYRTNVFSEDGFHTISFGKQKQINDKGNLDELEEVSLGSMSVASKNTRNHTSESSDDDSEEDIITLGSSQLSTSSPDLPAIHKKKKKKAHDEKAKPGWASRSAKSDWKTRSSQSKSYQTVLQNEDSTGKPEWVDRARKMKSASKLDWAARYGLESSLGVEPTHGTEEEKTEEGLDEDESPLSLGKASKTKSSKDGSAKYFHIPEDGEETEVENKTTNVTETTSKDFDTPTTTVPTTEKEDDVSTPESAQLMVDTRETLTSSLDIPQLDVAQEQDEATESEDSSDGEKDEKNEPTAKDTGKEHKSEESGKEDEEDIEEVKLPDEDEKISDVCSAGSDSSCDGGVYKEEDGDDDDSSDISDIDKDNDDIKKVEVETENEEDDDDDDSKPSWLKLKPANTPSIPHRTTPLPSPKVDYGAGGTTSPKWMASGSQLETTSNNKKTKVVTISNDDDSDESSNGEPEWMLKFKQMGLGKDTSI